jgi:hypothetical protein
MFSVGPTFTFVAFALVMEIVKDREVKEISLMQMARCSIRLIRLPTFFYVQIKARTYLRVNGLTFQMYFLSLFLVFATLSLFVTLMEIAIIYAFNVGAFTNPYAIIITVVLLIMFILPCLLFSAIFSYFFDRLESAQSIFQPLCYFTGMICAAAVS